MVLVWTQPDGWFFAGLAAMCVLLAVHFCGFFRAMAPRRRTLEWITFVDPPAPRFGCGPLVHAQLAWYELVLLLCIAVGTAFLQLRIRVPMELLRAVLHRAPLAERLEVLLIYAVSPAVCVLSVFFAARRLTDHPVLPYCAAFLMALDLNYDPEQLPFLLLAAAFLLRWWGASQTQTALPCALELLAMTAYLALGAYVAPQTLLAAVLLFAPVCFGAIFRASHTESPRRALRLFAALAGYWAMLALWMTLIRIPGALLETGLPFFQMFADARFWSALGAQITAAVAALQHPGTPLFAIFSLPAQLYALFAALAGIWLAVKRRDLCGLLMAWLFLAGTALWALDLAAPAFGSLLPCAYIWSRWLRRGRGAAVGIAVLLAVSFAALVLLLIL